MPNRQLKSFLVTETKTAKFLQKTRELAAALTLLYLKRQEIIISNPGGIVVGLLYILLQFIHKIIISLRYTYKINNFTS